MSVEVAKSEIFGEQEAFSERWTRQHGLPDVIPADPAREIYRDFSPAEVLSDIAAIGLSDQHVWYRASVAIEAGDKNFRRAARTGLLGLLVLDHRMRAGRIDSVANMLNTEFGVTPQGIAQWLIVDQETRRCLALLFRLQGYEVADEEGIHDEISGLDAEGKLPSVGLRFSEYLRLRPDQIRTYLKAVQEAVGTDWGVVRVAYTIFRCLGFPHENGKFAEELIGKYVYDGKKGDLDPREVAPFIEKFEDPVSGKSLAEVLQTEGIIGLARALNRLPAEKIAREWADMQLLLDMMDKISDIREGKGGAGTLKVSQRLDAIKELEEFKIALAKRKLRPPTIKRLVDPRRIKYVRGMVERDKGGWRDFFADLGLVPSQPKEKQ
ncbi:MAG: hypothetical protein ACPLXP_00205 [Microgenomates group bacterium]